MPFSNQSSIFCFLYVIIYPMSYFYTCYKGHNILKLLYFCFKVFLNVKKILLCLLFPLLFSPYVVPDVHPVSFYFHLRTSFYHFLLCWCLLNFLNISTPYYFSFDFYKSFLLLINFKVINLLFKFFQKKTDYLI